METVFPKNLLLCCSEKVAILLLKKANVYASTLLFFHYQLSLSVLLIKTEAVTESDSLKIA